MTKLAVEKPFPNFALKNQDNVLKKLSDYAGKWLVLYVYPKDDTPGCTIENKAFTATKAEFQKLNTALVGLSADSVESHQNFCTKYNLTTDLLSDPETTLLQAADVGQSDYKGTKYWNRTTFLIDPKGTLKKVYENVSPEGHEKILLGDIKKFQ